MAHCHFCRPAPELDRGQPDVGNPYQFLGTCPECGRWFLCENLPLPSRSRIVHLRDVPLLAHYGLRPIALPDPEWSGVPDPGGELVSADSLSAAIHAVPSGASSG